MYVHILPEKRLTFRDKFIELNMDVEYMIPNTDQIKHTCNSLAETQASILQLNIHKDTECHPALDCPKHLAPVVTIRQWLWQALEKE